MKKNGKKEIPYGILQKARMIMRITCIFTLFFIFSGYARSHA